MNGPGWTSIAAIVALTIVETVALFNGINGTLLTLVVAAISGLGGYSIRSFVQGDSHGSSADR